MLSSNTDSNSTSEHDATNYAKNDADKDFTCNNYPSISIDIDIGIGIDIVLSSPYNYFS